jgi:hypothetical protein
MPGTKYASETGSGRISSTGLEVQDQSGGITM